MRVFKKSKRSLKKSTSDVKKSTSEKKFSELKLRRDIMREGRVLNRHPGAMEIVADKVCREVEKWAKERDEVTQKELDKATAARIRKYDADVAYLYRMRGRWI